MNLFKNYRTWMFLLVFILGMSTSSFISIEDHTYDNSDLVGWVILGEQTVSEEADLDVLDITETKESFKQLKFKVLKAAISIRNIEIVYNDGTSEGHIISRRFKKGDASRVLHLIGNERIIEKIIFNYTPRKSGGGQAHLVVRAKQ